MMVEKAACPKEYVKKQVNIRKQEKIICMRN